MVRMSIFADPEPITAQKVIGWKIQCRECLDFFISKRVDRDTCGSRCRKRKGRRKDKDSAPAPEEP